MTKEGAMRTRAEILKLVAVLEAGWQWGRHGSHQETDIEAVDRDMHEAAAVIRELLDERTETPNINSQGA